MIAAPPLLSGAPNDTLAEETPAVALTAVGAPGRVLGVVKFETVDAGLAPTALDAVTLKA